MQYRHRSNRRFSAQGRGQGYAALRKVPARPPDAAGGRYRRAFQFRAAPPGEKNSTAAGLNSRANPGYGCGLRDFRMGAKTVPGKRVYCGLFVRGERLLGVVDARI